MNPVKRALVLNFVSTRCLPLVWVLLLVAMPGRSAVAQLTVEANSVLGFAAGDMRDAHSVGLGLNLGARYSKEDQIVDMGLNVGYLRFFTKQGLPNANNYTDVIPVHLSLQFHQRLNSPRIKWVPYGGIQLGTTVINRNLANTLEGGSFNVTSTTFSFGPRVGLRYRLNQHLSIEGYVQYTATFSNELRYGFASLGAGAHYYFKLY